MVAGTGVTLSNNSGEGATPTIAVDTSVIQARVTNVTDTEIGYLDGVTSAIQTQIDTKAPLDSPTFTGTPTLPTGTTATTQASGNNSTAVATTEFVTSAITIPKMYVTKYTTYTDTSWTCPAGVTQIKLTLIGAGGASGDTSAIGQNGTASFTSAADTAGATSFTAGGTQYAAVGGKKGLDHIVTADTIDVEGDFDLWISGGSSSSGTEVDAIRYPGCGGAPSVCSVASQRTFILGGINDRLVSFVRVYARSLRGQDGLTEVFQVAVTPGTTYSFTIGKGAGFVANSNVTDTYMGSNGAVIIEYVV